MKGLLKQLILILTDRLHQPQVRGKQLTVDKILMLEIYRLRSKNPLCGSVDLRLDPVNPSFSGWLNLDGLAKIAVTIFNKYNK